MAWLDTVMGGLNNLTGGSLGPIAQLFGLYGANQAINKYNVASPAENASMALYKALLDPNSKQMSGLTSQIRARNLADFQTGLTEMQLADRRATANGHAPTFFNPERADESVSYLTSRGLPRLNSMASDEAAKRIYAAASGIGGYAPAQYSRQIVSGENMINNYSIPDQLFKMYQQGGFSQTPMR